MCRLESIEKWGSDRLADALLTPYLWIVNVVRSEENAK
jgi:hypothetical protein